MLEYNLHTHTTRCHHAYGSEEEYIEAAIAGGMKLLGFSDHTPYPFPKDHISDFRMSVDDLEDYVDTILKLRDKYKDDIDIRLGLEMEWYPAYFDKLMELTDPYPFDYFILGQHFINNEVGEDHATVETHSRVRLSQYVDQCIQAIGTGRFLYIAHPDLLNFRLVTDGDRDFFFEESLRLAQAAKEENVPLEVNGQGLRYNRNYPNELFWKAAGQIKASAVFGCDAHCVEDVVPVETAKDGDRLLAKYGLETMSLEEIKKQLDVSKLDR